MKARVVKRESRTSLELTLQMYVDRVELRLDKQACLKCDICSRVCPREAVTILAGEEALDITIDPWRCLLCEICSHFCPVQAVSLSYNGQPKTIFAAHQGLAPFYPKITLDPAKCPQPCPVLPEPEAHWCRHERKLIAASGAECPKNCRLCLEACPRQALLWDEAVLQMVTQADLCLRCAQCLTACPYGAIEVTPQFRGQLTIADHKCPPDCVKCINLCPVKAIIREGERVRVRLEDCSFCGVCLNICDQEAITLVREEVVAEPGEFSQAWEQAVAKLLSQ